MANKLCTLLSRAEIRDLVDVRALEEAGFSVEEALPAAQMKDGGLTPGQLAWVLSQVEIGEDAAIPGGLSPADLREYLLGLEKRLARLAFPT
jgi:aryl-alcohol dehydrogenase-like predicted oxidoreductase